MPSMSYEDEGESHIPEFYAKAEPIWIKISELGFESLCPILRSCDPAQFLNLLSLSFLICKIEVLILIWISLGG